jgi:hypothetical protein
VTITVKEFIEILQKENLNSIMLHKKHGVWERLEYEDIVILENSVGIDD